MREYVKPVMAIEEYELNNHVSACTPESFIAPIDILCAIKSGEQHGVFDVGYTGTIPDGYSRCTTDDSAVSLKILGQDGDNDTTYTTYAIWYGSRGGDPEQGSYDSETGKGSGRALMEALKAAGANGGDRDNVLHAGVATTELISTLNMS